ncbi:uncharacterized protein LOC125515250 isoform X1 [Triticum urartu]|uniref:uncharacterized protein LOC125515250 isoform X1 n=1 Tax=Triticum urartu TaxID=4572 RepID=UPI00204413D2|nr:uncharacterized protein LOC125515250 isoform X1 [Triticum urartu]
MEGHHLFRETATRHRGRPPLLAPPPRRRWGRRPLLKLVSRRSPVCFYISLDPGFLVGELHPCSFFSFYSCLRICVSLLPPPTSASEFEATNYSAVLQKQVTGWEVKNEGDILKLHRAWKVTTQIFTLLVGIM